MIRIKQKRNPIDKEFLDSIEILRKESIIFFTYEISYKNKQIGKFEIKKGTDFIWEMDIEEKYKRRGLATFMHKYIENDLGIKIIPSKFLTREGKLFYGIKPRT